MELTDVLVATGLEAYREVLAERWEETQATLPSTLPFFLDAAFVEAACRDAYLPAEATAGALRAACRVAGDAQLQALAWHCHRCLYHAPGYPGTLVHRWPHLDAALGEDAGGFYLLVLLSNMAALRALYAEHAIPTDVARATLEDIQRWYAFHDTAPSGMRGLLPRRLGWLRNHLTGGIYHLVRLQFQPGRFQGSARFYRHRQSGRVLALSEDGIRYRSDGQRDGAGGVHDDAGAWTARLEVGDGDVSGVPLSPFGRALPETVRLSLEEWRQELAPGDPVLHLHIPAGSPMDYAQCGESLCEALRFFPRHFPERRFVAFTCSSWLLDPQFEALLPPSSNIVRFLQEMYLLPGRSGNGGVLERVFGDSGIDLRQAPRDTTLRRVVLNHLLAGGHFRGGGSVLFPVDLDWGAQVYRERHDPDTKAT